MRWNLKCRRVRKLLALWAGNDLEGAARIEAERHLVLCPCCRDHWSGLQTGQRALERARANPEAGLGHERSVWPAVARQIRALEQPPAAPRWHGWLPAGALAAACLAILMTIAPSPTGLNSASTAGRVPVIDVRQVDNPVPGMFDGTGNEWRPFAPRGAHEGSVRPWSAPPDAPRVRTLLDGTDVRDL